MTAHKGVSQQMEHSFLLLEVQWGRVVCAGGSGGGDEREREREQTKTTPEGEGSSELNSAWHMTVPPQPTQSCYTHHTGVSSR